MTAQGAGAATGDRGHVLEEARTRWLHEECVYAEFGRIVAARLRSVALCAGVNASIEYRVKSIDSLIKKLIRKPRYTFQTLGDKIGARVVVHHVREVDEIVAHLGSSFKCSELDDKSDVLGDDRVGYQSVHVEVRLQEADPDAGRFPPEAFCAEVQIRTLAQHLWSEMSHDVTYKGGVQLPQDIRRRFHLLAGLIELADNEFSRLEQEVNGLPDMHEVTILKALERQYYRLTSRPADRALSLEVIRLLRPLYPTPPADWYTYFSELLTEKQEFFRDVFDLAQDNPTRSVFLFQPEVLMIYDQLHRNPYRVREAWVSQYPEQELERLAVALGLSFA